MEQVLVVEKYKLDNFVNWENASLIREYNNELQEVVNKEYFFMNRPDAENDIEHKQVITYAFLTCEDSIFVLKRLSKQNEKRLHNMYSLGVGGHINPTNSKELEDRDIIEVGLLRELHEEIDVVTDNISSIELIGAINDESNEVGKVHIGFLYQIVLRNLNIKVLETEKMSGSWISKANLRDYYEGMESWSQIIIDKFIEGGNY